jgi:hypothetical protein
MSAPARAALQAAEAAGVGVTLDGDKLRLSAASPAPDAVIELISAHKPEIIELLRRHAKATAEVDTTGHSLSSLSAYARAHTYKRYPERPCPVVSTSDPADWVGEYEDVLGVVADDYGDETEHDAWLAGTPAAELWPAS